MKYYVLLIFVSVALFSCEKNRSDVNSERIDSLLSVISEQRQQMEESNGAIEEIASTLDSISIYQDLLMANPEGTPTKLSLVDNLQRFKRYIELQKEKLSQLQDSLNNSQTTNRSVFVIIDNLNSLLQEKEQQVIKLTAEVGRGKRDIAALKEDVANLMNTNSNLKEENELLTQVAETQDKIINRGYFIAGTSKELKEIGVINGSGFLKKKTINVSGINKDAFIGVDIRTATEIQINGKSPKILSQVPEGSFHWNGNKLVIDNPSSFWSITQFLVIQVK